MDTMRILLTIYQLGKFYMVSFMIIISIFYIVLNHMENIINNKLLSKIMITFNLLFYFTFILSQ